MVVDVVMMMVLVGVRAVVVCRLPLSVGVDVLMSVLVRTMPRLCVRHVIGAFSLPFPIPIQFALCPLAFSLRYDLAHALPIARLDLPVHTLRFFTTWRRSRPSVGL